MKRNLSLLFAAGALAAFLFSSVNAGQKKLNEDKIIYLKSGAMIIPINGVGGDEVVHGDTKRGH